MFLLWLKELWLHTRERGAEMIPDYLIYDELQRRREREKEWEPEPLRLPLYAPEMPERREEEEEHDDAPRGVIIIDMCRCSDFD